MLETKSVNFSYGSQVSFSFPDIHMAGEDHLLMLGRSGVGKTTYLHLIAGLLKPSSGSIEIDSQNIAILSERQTDHFRGKNIGLIFQHPHFIRAITLLENIVLAQYLGSGKRDKVKAVQLLDRLGLSERSGQKPHMLSRGEQQRSAVAMALVNNPSLILADEPTASLDDESCENVAHLLIENAKLNKAKLLIITHDQRLKNFFDKHVTL